MKNLARSQSRVAILLKVLRQRHVVRMLRPKISIVVHDASLRRVATVQHRATRRITQRKLRVSSIETRAARGETVNIRRLDDRIAVTAQLRPQVVRDDKEYIVFLLRRWRARRDVGRSS